MIVEIKGKINTISTSNTRKIKAIKKNRKDRGMRGRDRGVNPHSKGLLFIRSRLDFIIRDFPNRSSKVLNKREKTIINIKILINPLRV